VQYCAVDLSSFYLDVLKDRLYCEARDGRRRRSAQTVLFRILDDLCRLMAPVLPFTSEEAWQSSGNRSTSVHLERFPETSPSQSAAGYWPALRDARDQVLKSLEESRATKFIGTSLEAK